MFSETIQFVCVRYDKLSKCKIWRTYVFSYEPLILFVISILTSSFPFFLENVVFPHKCFLVVLYEIVFTFLTMM